ncbi:hypothetical protein MNBD_GAMMA15-2008 [hydrothermal vent metagenome]|uniref:FimV N-terminal domain-containing protein n=1 Tax=hydrothermal vent metagenome TaxID=652676 RepID=A0A3B0Z008_9ZZZZ
MAIAMLGAAATANVAALGLGDIELKSALNQPLNAEVELLSATDAEMQEVKVVMGSPRAFEQAGVDRPLFLSKLKFRVTRNDAGKPVVHITSRDVIREPFLDFLMEISWSKGRLLREYTVLVDPPLTMPAPAPVVQAPAARVAPIQSAPVQSAPIASQAQVRQTARQPYPVAPGEYGPTKRNDTLWEIAQQVRPDGVSIEQTMLGLLRANPEAFVRNNINNLKAGYVLRVPEREELTSVSRIDAHRESSAQYAEWRAARDGTVARSGASIAPVSAVNEPSLQLVAAEGVSAAGATGSAEAGADINALQRELIMANEAMEAQRRQSEDMSGRLAVLEEQIQNMQRLIQLKDDALAQLQLQAGAESVVADDVAVETEVLIDETVAETGDVAIVDVMAEAGIDAANEEVAVGPAVEGMPAADLMAEDSAPPAIEDMTPEQLVAIDGPEVAVTDTTDAVVEETTSEVEAEPVVPAVPETATTPGFVERLMNNPMWLGAGGAVLALFAFFGLRRKRGIETEFQESILQAAGNDSSVGSDSEIVSTGSGETATSESSLLSEFAVSDMGSMRNDGEADPLAEADVYLAYGRFQQAEDLIADALEKDAENEDLNLKMLEVFLASKNQSAFDGHAELILARIEDSDSPLWQKVAEMGREINSENPIYQSGGASTSAVADTAEEMDSLNNEVEFDVDDSGNGEEAAAAEKAVEDEGLDFDLDLSYDVNKEADENKPDSVEFTPPEGIGDTSSLDIDMDSVEPDAIEQENTLDFDIDSLDLDGDEAEADSGEGQLTDMDEVSTKLDLARAYIDMGDPDGARSILDEVIEEGSDGQKDEARGIMEQIA